MITATITPTQPLRGSVAMDEPESERSYPVWLRDSKSATFDDPVVLIRGCTQIALSVATTKPAPSITWTIVGLQSNNVGLAPPRLDSPNASRSRLSTNAVGLYCVTAKIVGTDGSTVEYHWHVRFIDLRVPGDPVGVLNGTLDIRDGQFPRTASVLASFGFTAKVVLSGAENAPRQYDKVKVGILQNVFQKSTDPGCKPLYGLYYRSDGTVIKLGELAEPVPTIDSPHLDADPGSKKFFPFMHDGHVTVTPTSQVGAVRSIKLEDKPGVHMPLYFNSTGDKDSKNWRHNVPSLEDAKKSASCYALYGIGGCLKFISAVAAFSKDAKFNYVVFDKYEFTMEANARVSEQNLKGRDESERPIRDPKVIGIPNHSPCFQFISYTRLLTPADATDAQMETWGPVATKGGSVYTWTYT